MSLASLLTIPQVKRFLQDGDVYADLEAIMETHALPGERVGEILDLTDAVLDGQIEIREIPALVKEAFGIADNREVSIAADIVGIRLLPLKMFLQGVEDQLVAWGAQVKSYPPRTIEKEALTAQAFAQRIATRANLSFSDLLIKRLALLLEQRVNNQKTNESLRTFFGRSLTIGGMGLEKDQIDALMQAVTDAVPGVRIVDEDEAIDVQDDTPAVEPTVVEDTNEEQSTPITALEIPPTHNVAAEVPVISSPMQEEKRVEERVQKTSVVQQEDRPDVSDKKKAEKAKKAQDEAIKTAFTDAVDVALEKAHSTLEEANIPSGAFADIVGKMLRGIRDQYQTRDVVERDYNIKGDVLARIMSILLEANEAYRIAVHALGQVEARVETTITEHDAEMLEAQEARRMQEKFASLTKDSEKITPATVELTVGSVAPPRDKGAQKRVTDVVAGNRLMGPVEQLEALTLAYFRRLSTNPEEAVRKMSALLEALQKTSYEERIRGILSWRKSPLANLYIALMTESLNAGVSVAEVAARRRAQGKESLGPAEMQALAKWNEKTRF